MFLIDFFLSSKNKNTANIAKKRLHVLIEKKRKNNYKFYNSNKLKQDLLKVINKYFKVTKIISLNLYNKKNDTFILECNIKYHR